MNNIVGKVGFEPTIAFANRFTVCHLKPLSHFPIEKWLLRTGIEPVVSPWKGNVLTDTLTEQSLAGITGFEPASLSTTN